MNKKPHNSRLSLTLLFSAVILIFLIITLAFAIVGGYILIETGVVKFTDEAGFTLMQAFLFLAFNSLIMGSILSALVSKFPLKPINKIISQMNRLASGDFKARLDFKGPLANIPATKEVCESFNKMADELDTTEMLRSDFINNFSHEFKTPIVSIAGFAKLLKRGNLTEEQRAEYIDIIEQESLRLSSMATNVLNLTKYENQTILTNVTKYNLSEQIRSCIVTLEGKWAKKNIDFNLNFAEYDIYANKDMLKHVWLNLIDNAVKFSPDNKTIDIDIKATDKSCIVSVSNYGADILPEQQEKIFNKFYQADESHAGEGNGIGLALVKGVVELHKGEVFVTSKDGYITFKVTIPLNLQ